MSNTHHLETASSRVPPHDVGSQFQEEINREWTANAPRRIKEAQLERQEHQTQLCLNEVSSRYDALPIETRKGINDDYAKGLFNIQRKICHAVSSGSFYPSHGK
jgi:hypothetical protein